MDYKDFDNLADAFSYWRKRHSYSLADANHITGLSKTTITRLESGVKPQIKALEKVAVVFHSSPGKIYDYFYWDKTSKKTNE